MFSLILLFASNVSSTLVSVEPFVQYTELELSQKQINAVPKAFLPHHETLIKVMLSTWKDIPIPSIVPALIEQETCPSLTHWKCWNTKAELKTDREYGFGLGQLTVTSRFNAFDEMKALDQRLRQWRWEDRYNAENQMIATVVMLKRNYNVFKAVTDTQERMAFATASYNGGIGGIQADQRVCRNTKGCDPNRWFNNVEHTSLKAKVALHGYGKSFFETNREHSRNIFKIRRFKYEPFVDPYFKGETI